MSADAPLTVESADTRVEHQVWAEETDGIRHHAHFLTEPESYDTREQAEIMAQRYNDEQVGWDRPLPHRRFYVREATITTTYADVVTPPERTTP